MRKKKFEIPDGSLTVNKLIESYTKVRIELLKENPIVEFRGTVVTLAQFHALLRRLPNYQEIIGNSNWFGKIPIIEDSDIPSGFVKGIFYDGQTKLFSLA